MEQQDYYEVGSRDNIVISNSSLNYIDPIRGGSPQAFLNFLDCKQVEEKSYFRMGKYIHLYHEDKENFKVSSVSKPSDKLGIVADRILDAIDCGNIFTDELCLAVARSCHYQDNYKDATLKDKVFNECKDYITEVIEAEENNQIYITDTERITLENCIASIEKHPKAKELMFGQSSDFNNTKVYKEIEIYWSKEFSNALGLQEIKTCLLQFKAKLDNLAIDFDKKIVTYTDPKTSSQSPYAFVESFKKYSYHRQHAFYTWAIKEWAKQNNIDLTDFIFQYYNIVIETSGLYQVGVVQPDLLYIEQGRKEYQSLVKRLVYHISTNQWNYSMEEMENSFVIPINYTV